MGNIKLLKEVRENIVLNPETHNQKTWFCETSMCIAGHAALMSGKVKVLKDPAFGLYLADEDGDAVSAAGVAQDELELTDSERGYLFYCMDDFTSIKRMDQVIELWEEGKTLDDIEWEDRIPDPSDDDDSEY
jgi:hypothetical protein